MVQPVNASLQAAIEQLRNYEDPDFRTVRSPLTERMLRPLDPRCQVVQFDSLLTDDEFRRLAQFLDGYPDVKLRAFGGYDGSIRDLEFLRYFPAVEHFSAEALWGLEDISGLRHLDTALRSLVIGRTKKKLSLRPLERFTQLTALNLEGQSRDLDVLSGLISLRGLSLRSITLPNLDLIRPLTELRALDIKLGGTTNLDGIVGLGNLKYLELWMIRGFEDLTPIQGASSLTLLFLQAMKNVTRIPDLHDLNHLKWIVLDTMKGITDLTPLLTAPVLEQIDLIEMRHLDLDEIRELAAHPKLTRASIGRSGNDRAKDALPLPPTTFRAMLYRAEVVWGAE